MNKELWSSTSNAKKLTRKNELPSRLNVQSEKSKNDYSNFTRIKGLKKYAKFLKDSGEIGFSRDVETQISKNTLINFKGQKEYSEIYQNMRRKGWLISSEQTLSFEHSQKRMQTFINKKENALWLVILVRGWVTSNNINDSEIEDYLRERKDNIVVNKSIEKIREWIKKLKPEQKNKFTLDLEKEIFIEGHVEWAREYALREFALWFRGLKINEANAFKRYTTESDQINWFLRKKEYIFIDDRGKKSKPKLEKELKDEYEIKDLEKVKKEIQDLANSLHRATIEKSIIVHRWVDIWYFKNLIDNKDFKKNKEKLINFDKTLNAVAANEFIETLKKVAKNEYSDPAFVSTSLTRNSPGLDLWWKKDLFLIEIKIPKGSHVAYMSKKINPFFSEGSNNINEILIQKGTSFKVNLDKINIVHDINNRLVLKISLEMLGSSNELSKKI